MTRPKRSEIFDRGVLVVSGAIFRVIYLSATIYAAKRLDLDL